MNAFERKLQEVGHIGLKACDLRVIQVNVGLVCNQMCHHCHVKASPHRRESMEWPVMERIVALAAEARPEWVDITGGAPELNPHFRRFVTRLRAAGVVVQVRTNLTVLLEPEQKDTVEFLRTHAIHLVASMPCYLEENVDSQRGVGVYAKSVQALQMLNRAGYGREKHLPMSLVYNPVGQSLPPPQENLEAEYRCELYKRFGIEFTRLLTLANVPIGRFRTDLRKAGKEKDYIALLEHAFNADTLEGLMCRHQIEVAWDGTLYDCDFNLALRYPVNHGLPTNIRDLDARALPERYIATGNHCFACTAGRGSSCGGALVQE